MHGFVVSVPAASTASRGRQWHECRMRRASYRERRAKNRLAGSCHAYNRN